MLKPLLQDTVVCVTVLHLDGLVLARSAVNHTMNYRSAMIYGQFDKWPTSASSMRPCMR